MAHNVFDSIKEEVKEGPELVKAKCAILRGMAKYSQVNKNSIICNILLQITFNIRLTKVGICTNACGVTESQLMLKLITKFSSLLALFVIPSRKG
jgi:hypothetical protein